MRGSAYTILVESARSEEMESARIYSNVTSLTEAAYFFILSRSDGLLTLNSSKSPPDIFSKRMSDSNEGNVKVMYEQSSSRKTTRRRIILSEYTPVNKKGFWRPERTHPHNTQPN